MSDRERHDRWAFAHLVWLGLMGAVGCGAPAMIGPEPNEPGIEPEEAGAEAHLAAAHREEARLVQHQKAYDPKASQAVRRCNPNHSADNKGSPACWIETINPTSIHLTEVDIHRNRAAFHRKAARDLRAEEKRACSGIPDKFQGRSPLDRPRNILGVSPLEREGSKEVEGAVVILRRLTDLTPEVLQKIADCAIARSAVQGYGLPTFDANRSPLAERGARATVRPVKMGLAIEIRADDPFAARAILVRSQRMAAVE